MIIRFPARTRPSWRSERCWGLAQYLLMGGLIAIFAIQVLRLWRVWGLP